MDRFEEMRVFVRVMERRSFTRAAEDLQVPRATVTNAVKRLESRLGSRLLERTTRQVRATLEGDAYYQQCIRLLADLEEVEGSFRQAAPQGLLRVNLQGTLARLFVIPALPDFFRRYPDIALTIGEDDRFVDLIREGVDCVMRVGTLQDSSLVARRVGDLQQVTCASPDYFAMHGVPRSWNDLAGHRAVNYMSSATGKAYPLEFLVDGELKQFTLPASVSVTGVEAYAAAAKAGLGLVQAPRYRIRNELEAGSLRVVLADTPPPALPVSILYPQTRQLSPRVRAFADWLKQTMAVALERQ
jgi:DNA-binding transcriptional LysR family regulator